MKAIDAIKGFGLKAFTKAKVHSPELLLVAGTGLVIAGVIVACKETEKLDPILEKAEIKKDDIKNDIYVKESEKTRDLAVNYVKTAGKVALNYAPAVSLVGTGIVCFYASYGIIRKRNVAISAAYNGLDAAFKKYRSTIKEKLGDEEEDKLYHGIKSKKITEGKGDNKTKKEVDILPDDPNSYSPYAKFFDEFSDCFKKNDAEYNLMFLKAQQNYASDLLRLNGHLFLNEVYDMLGIPRTQEGQVVGWLKGKGDDFVDFGLYNGNKERVRAFVNGTEPAILLDFNVDGVIINDI